MTPSGYAGADVRAAPVAASGIVNYSTNPHTRATGVFTYAQAGAIHPLKGGRTDSALMSIRLGHHDERHWGVAGQVDGDRADDTVRDQ